MYQFGLESVILAKTFVVWMILMYATVKGEIRCYCNHPSCVATGYMCKSSVGSCFTELSGPRRHYGDLAKSRHGCMELLSPPKKERCQRVPLTLPVEGRLPLTQLPLIVCCSEDMCNYENAMEANIILQHTEVNRSFGPGSPDYEERKAYETALRQDIWFKAAVIAVPIAGGFILILLILLATRMLRQDNKRQRQLLELRRQQKLFDKPHLVVTQPCHVHNGTKQSHGYRNVNLSMSSDNCCTDFNSVFSEKQHSCDTFSIKDNSMSASLLPWTQWNPQKTSTLV